MVNSCPFCGSTQKVDAGFDGSVGLLGITYVLFQKWFTKRNFRNKKQPEILNFPQPVAHWPGACIILHNIRFSGLAAGASPFQ